MVLYFKIQCPSVLAYRNTTHFCAFILHPMTLLNSLLGSKRNTFFFFCRFLGIFYVDNMSSVKRDCFIDFFPIYVPFISFFCLITLARTASTILNKRGWSRHPCLVPGFKGKALSLLLLSIILAVTILQMLFIKFLKFPSVPSFLGLSQHEWVLNCAKHFYASTDTITRLLIKYSRLL